MARPLHNVCKNGTKFNWTEKQSWSWSYGSWVTTAYVISAFQYLSFEFESHPGGGVFNITLCDLACQLILDTETSSHSLGVVISQQTDGLEHAIAYMNKSLSKHELSYCNTRKELLVVAMTLKNCQRYLHGRQILIGKDKSLVTWM